MKLQQLHKTTKTVHYHGLELEVPLNVGYLAVSETSPGVGVLVGYESCPWYTEDCGWDSNKFEVCLADVELEGTHEKNTLEYL